MTTIIRAEGGRDMLEVSLIVVSVLALIATAAFMVYLFQRLGAVDASGTDRVEVEVVLPKIGDPEPKTQN